MHEPLACARLVGSGLRGSPGWNPSGGRGWHSLRRKFASDLMDLPLKVLCDLEAGRRPRPCSSAIRGPTRTGSGKPSRSTEGLMARPIAEHNWRASNPPNPVSSIGAPGFEPGTSCSQSRRATGLRHAPPANNRDSIATLAANPFGSRFASSPASCRPCAHPPRQSGGALPATLPAGAGASLVSERPGLQAHPMGSPISRRDICDHH